MQFRWEDMEELMFVQSSTLPLVHELFDGRKWVYLILPHQIYLWFPNRSSNIPAIRVTPEDLCVSVALTMYLRSGLPGNVPVHATR
jgi:hypothetical protein